MQRLTYLFFTFFCWYYVSGQNDLPVIKANSSIVDIRVGDDYFIKAGWHLEPDKKPDIFSIGSKWPYVAKKVSFITDIDSISFEVAPGNAYDFIVVLNESEHCHIRIATSPDPIFLNLEILVPVGLAFVIIIVLVCLNIDRVGTVNLLKLGYIIPFLFWIMTFISGAMLGNYNHFKDVISELGAIGTQTEIVTSTAFMLLALLSILFSVGFYKASQQFNLSRVPAILSFSKPVALVWAAIFPLGNEFHSLTGPLPLLTILGSFLCFILWKKKGFLSLRIISLMSSFVMALILLRFIKPFGMEYEGLIQRFFYLGWTVWLIALSAFFIRRHGMQ